MEAVYGERAEVRDCYNEMTLKFKKGEGKGNRMVVMISVKTTL